MKRIIFAEDDPTIQDVVKLILETDYLVTIFPEGDALLKNNFEVPDLFLLDKQLSGLDGLDICRYLKAQDHTRHIPVIIITATPSINILARNAGADNVIEKPFSMQALRQVIAEHIG